jgi:hypothetical protein
MAEANTPQTTGSVTSKKRWSFVSTCLQKEHMGSPDHFLFFHIFTSKDSIFTLLPHEDLNFEWNFGFPYPIVMRSSQVLLQQGVNRSSGENSIFI